MNDPRASLVPEEQADDPTELSTLTSIYLVEPRRASSAVLKFSGTLGMVHRSDRRSATIMAFSHFVLEDAACRYMFADIQGKSVFECLSFCCLRRCRIDGSTQFCAE